MPILLQINVTANWGSTGRIEEACNLIAKSKGWDTYSAFGRYANHANSKIIKIGNNFDVYEHYLENRLFDNEGLASQRATHSLVKKIKKIRPDIVHIHNIHDHWLNYQILFNYLNTTNIKVVWTFHDFWAITGHCAHFTYANCNKWETVCRKCPISNSLIDRSTRNFYLKKQLFSANNNLYIVSVSEWVGNIVKKSFLGNKNCRIIENGVDATVFKPTMQCELDSSSTIHEFFQNVKDKYIILAVSSQWKSKGKGLEDFIAMSNLLKEDEVIVLVGIDDKSNTHLPKNILSVKRTNNQQELAAIYTRADVVTSFSSAETFGLTIVEGFACGTPAVVYDNTAPPKLITSTTGFVVPNKDYEAAYNAIQVLKSNNKAYYSDACIKLVKEKYNKEQCYEKYMHLYEEIISN